MGKMGVCIIRAMTSLEIAIPQLQHLNCNSLGTRMLELHSQSALSFIPCLFLLDSNPGITI
jgi:hypothetical protein